jgi:Delta7-sterol 5-desaturase
MLQFPPFSFPSITISLAIVTFFIILRYFLIAGFFYWALWKRPPETVKARRIAKEPPTTKLMKHEIYWSVVSSVIYAASGVWLIEAWRSGGTAVYFGLMDYGIWWLLLSLPVYLFLHDTYFYWTHRLMHHPKVFAVVHKVHHESRQPTPWAGFAFHPWEALLGALILPMLAFTIPIHIGVLIFMLVLMSVTGITNHAGWEILPDSWVRGFVGRHWISATHHNVHHQKYSINYALYFRFWDRVMGTDEMELPADSAPVREPNIV